eukprot:327808-Pleurochrysis_carterae.AAC.2
MLAGTPYHRPAALAASKLRSYMTPGMQALVTSEESSRWAGGARAIQPRLKPAFPLNPSQGDSMTNALLRCERASARLRSALSVPPSNPDHAYLCSWVDRVEACDLGDLIRDDILLDTPVPERSSPALAFQPCTPSIEPPSTEPGSRRPGCSRRHATPRPWTPRKSSSPLSASKICKPGSTSFLTT